MEIIGKKESVAVMIVTAIVFAASNLSFVFSHTPFTSSVWEAVFHIRTLIDLFGITVLMVLQSRTQELVVEKDGEKRNEWLKELERELDIMGDTGHMGSNVPFLGIH